MTTSNHRKQVAIHLLRGPCHADIRREFPPAYGVVCPDGKVFSTLRDASLALGYRPGTLRTLRSQAGGPSRMTLRGLTATFLD